VLVAEHAFGNNAVGGLVEGQLKLGLAVEIAVEV
jgi:hypothetical protein